MKKIIKAIIISATLLSTQPASAMPAVDLGSEQTPTREATVTVVHGGVEVGNNSTEDADVAVYAITGQLVKHLRIHGGASTLVDLPSGCFIVRVDGLSRRVVIR